MKNFFTKAEIRSTSDRIWSILVDGEGYANWNPEINKVDGQIALGKTIKAHVVLHGGKVQPVSVVVTSYVPAQSMTWTGSLPLGLFTGLRTFQLAPLNSGLVEFTMNVQFGGLLSSLIAKSLGDRQADIDAFATGLKSWAERDQV